MTSLSEKIKACLGHGLTDAHRIAKRVGCDVRYVREIKSRLKNPDAVRAAARCFARRNGIRPREETLAEQARLSKKRLADIEPLLALGLSWSEAASKLGITKNVIAGLVHRNRNRERQVSA